MVGSSFIAANISTEQFIGLVGAAYVFGICGGDFTVVCKHLEYKFLRPCLGPAIYRITPRDDIHGLAASGVEFNTMTSSLQKMTARMSEAAQGGGEAVKALRASSELVFGDPERVEVTGADQESGAFMSPVLLRAEPGANVADLLVELRSRQNDAGAYRLWPGSDQVVEDLIRHRLVEDAAIPELDHVVLERFQLDAAISGHVRDPDLAEIWKAGLRADGGELRTIDRDLEVATRARIRKRLQRRA